jgi:hypothetical protein
MLVKQHAQWAGTASTCLEFLPVVLLTGYRLIEQTFLTSTLFALEQVFFFLIETCKLF